MGWLEDATFALMVGMFPIAVVPACIAYEAFFRRRATLRKTRIAQPLLTNAEKQAVEIAAAWLDASGHQRAIHDADALRGLLARFGHGGPLPAPPTDAK